MSALDDYLVIRGTFYGESLAPRRDIRPGDLVRRKDRVAEGGWRLVASDQQMRDFYRALGIDLWCDWRWLG